MDLLLKLNNELMQFAWHKRVIVGIILIAGFYGWIVFGLGVFGKLHIIASVFNVRAEDLNAIIPSQQLR